MIRLKSEQEIELMRQAGRIVGEVHDLLEELIAPGVTTQELDRVAEAEIRRRGAEPSFLGYRGYPATLCTSPNEVIIHGIPSPRTRLKEGDILSIDVGARYKGFHGDSARTHRVGRVAEEIDQLLRVTETCLWRAIAQCQPGNRLGDVGWAVEEFAKRFGYGIVDEFVGHGVGADLHEKPDVRHKGPPDQGLRLKAGMTIAIEPMINLGTPRVRMLKDGWTTVTADGKWSAHFEHTVAVREEGWEVLTLSPRHPGRMTGGPNPELAAERGAGRAA